VWVVVVEGVGVALGGVQSFANCAVLVLVPVLWALRHQHMRS